MSQSGREFIFAMIDCTPIKRIAALHRVINVVGTAVQSAEELFTAVANVITGIVEAAKAMMALAVPQAAPPMQPAFSYAAAPQRSLGGGVGLLSDHR